jgi:hypothetical protein
MQVLPLRTDMPSLDIYHLSLSVHRHSRSVIDRLLLIIILLAAVHISVVRILLLLRLDGDWIVRVHLLGLLTGRIDGLLVQVRIGSAFEDIGLGNEQQDDPSEGLENVFDENEGFVDLEAEVVVRDYGATIDDTE